VYFREKDFYSSNSQTSPTTSAEKNIVYFLVVFMVISCVVDDRNSMLAKWWGIFSDIRHLCERTLVIIVYVGGTKG